MASLFLRDKPLGLFKGVLFDKDGTLTSSENSLLQLANLRVVEAIKQLGKHIESETKLKKLEIFLQKIYGIEYGRISPNGCIAIASRDHNLISTATILTLLDLNWAEALFRANNIFLEVDKILIKQAESEKLKRPLLPGALRLLKELKGNNVKCALISNDSKEGIENFIKENNLNTIFQTFSSCEDYPAKPNPIAAKKLCEKINLNPSQCVLIGDAETDLKMSKEAKIELTLGFVGGWSTAPKLKAQQHLIYNWDELTTIKH